MAVLVLLLTGALSWLFLRSDWLSVGEVEVSGTARLAPAQVLAAAAVQRGRPLARIDTDEVSRRVLAALPPAERVTVGRDWPDTVTIRVQERTAAIAVAGEDGLSLVDGAGLVFAVEPEAPAGVPVVQAPADASVKTLRAAATVAESLPPDIEGQVEGIRAVSPDNITIRLTEDRTVLWGNAQRTARKAVVLEALMGQAAAVYDVSAPDAPTTRD